MFDGNEFGFWMQGNEVKIVNYHCDWQKHGWNFIAKHSILSCYAQKDIVIESDFPGRLGNASANMKRSNSLFSRNECKLY